MHRFLLLAILVPSLLLAQSKRKKLRIALEKEKQERIFLISNLKKHIEILASDSLEGRRTGTKGEMLAMEYLSSQYKIIGLEPANSSKYVHTCSRPLIIRSPTHC